MNRSAEGAAWSSGALLYPCTPFYGGGTMHDMNTGGWNNASSFPGDICPLQSIRVKQRQPNIYRDLFIKTSNHRSPANSSRSNT